MVCRDVRGGSYEVPQLTLATPEEKKLYEIGKGARYRFICLSPRLEKAVWTQNSERSDRWSLKRRWHGSLRRLPRRRRFIHST